MPKSRRFNIGGGFPVQPPHKPMVLPSDFLTAFYNVGLDDEDKAAKFCQDYGLFPFWILGDTTLSAGFSELYSKYRDVIEKILNLKKLSIYDLELINQGLEGSKMSVSIRQPQVDQIILEKRMWVPILESRNGIKPTYEVRMSGHPLEDAKNSRIKITVWQDDGGEDWHIKYVKKGVLKIDEIYPDEAWSSLEEFAKRLTLQSARCKDPSTCPLNIEFEYNAKTDFHLDDIYAAYSTTDLDSMICQYIWSAIQNKKFIKKHKKCVICGDLYTNCKSPVYCKKGGCRKEWDSRRERPKN